MTLSLAIHSTARGSGNFKFSVGPPHCILSKFKREVSVREIMALRDITNVSHVTTKRNVVKKRLSDGTHKVYQYNGSRKHIELVFNDESEKLQFESKLEEAKCTLGCRSVKDTLTAMLETYGKKTPQHLPCGYGSETALRLWC